MGTLPREFVAEAENFNQEGAEMTLVDVDAAAAAITIFHCFLAFAEARNIPARIIKLLTHKVEETPIDRELVTGLFLSSAVGTDYIPPSDWRGGEANVDVAGIQTYGHEAAVLKSIAGFIGVGLPSWDKVDEEWSPRPSYSKVLLASGRSNRFTANVLGTPDRPIFKTRDGIARGGFRLPYSIGLGTGLVKRPQYNQEHIVRRNAIISEGNAATLVADTETPDGEQISDYLLVTRIPGPVPETVITILAGLHGPGTRSAELLFNSISNHELQRLAELVDFTPGTVPLTKQFFVLLSFKLSMGLRFLLGSNS
jgi:hypothetical protein